MIYQEIRRKFFHPLNIIIYLLAAYQFFLMIRPADRFQYYKPLDRTEFVYFHMTEDYEKNTTLIYETENWYQREIHMSEKQRAYMLRVIRKMNPKYDTGEKMSEVEISVSFQELQPMLKELEEVLGEQSFYDTVFEKLSYGDYSFRRYSDQDFAKREQDFLQAYQAGISNAYARAGLDAMGVVFGFLCVVFSFCRYYEEKIYGMKGFLYTSDISSVRLVIGKYLADLIPLSVLSIFFAVLEYVFFSYWNRCFSYGYEISLFAFLRSVVCVIVPSIMVIIAISHFLGILFENEMYTVIIQFILYYLSLAGSSDRWKGAALIVRYGDFDDYSAYVMEAGRIGRNRWVMIVLSMVLLLFVTLIFVWIRVHGRSYFLRKVTGRLSQMWRDVFRPSGRKTGKKIEQTGHGRSYYYFRQVVGWNCIFYVLYCLGILPVVCTRSMDLYDLAVVGENILIFASLFLLIRLGNYEASYKVDGFIATTETPYGMIYLERLLLAGGVLLVLLGIPCLLLSIRYHVFVQAWFFDVYITSLFLGMLSLFVAELLESSLAGYFFYLFYYCMNVILGKNMILNMLGYTNLEMPEYTQEIRNTKISLAIVAGILVCLVTGYADWKSKGGGLKKYYESRNY